MTRLEGGCSIRWTMGRKETAQGVEPCPICNWFGLPNCRQSAEGTGFEPVGVLPPSVFKTDAINRSANPLNKAVASILQHNRTPSFDGTIILHAYRYYLLGAEPRTTAYSAVCILWGLYSSSPFGVTKGLTPFKSTLEVPRLSWWVCGNLNRTAYILKYQCVSGFHLYLYISRYSLATRTSTQIYKWSLV